MKNNHLSSWEPYTSFLTRMSLGTSGLHYTALAGLISLVLFTSATATDFSGSLKGATITDAANTNKPPVATFTYAINGNTVTFDASGSTDPDGNITKYKWDFGNGITSEGVTTTYTLTGPANLQVTLTVVDNNNGVALSQQTISPYSAGVADDFSTNTSANYTRAYGTGVLVVTDGYAHISSTWQGRNVYYHNTTLGKPDMHVWGNLDNQSDSGGLAFRINPSNQTCYVAYFDGSGYLTIKGFNLSSGSWGTTDIYSSGIYATGSKLVDIIITGTSLIAKVDGATAITTTVSEFSTGNYAGILLYRDSSDPKIYDFNAGAN